MKVEELSGALLDVWVAQADGWVITRPQGLQIAKNGEVKFCMSKEDISYYGLYECHLFSPSTKWQDGGPIIDKHWRTITAWFIEYFGFNWRDHIDDVPGSTLCWFMRAFVASKFGDEVSDILS